MTPRWITWGRRILNGTAALIVVAAVALAIHSHLATDLIVRSGSMSPAIPVGALVIVEAADPASLRTGMVVTVSEDNGVLVTHRIHRLIELKGHRYLELKGDANQTPDPVLVPAGQVVGRVSAVVPVLGFGLAALSLPSGQITVLAVIALLIALGWLLEDLTPTRPGVAPTREPAVPSAHA